MSGMVHLGCYDKMQQNMHASGMLPPGHSFLNPSNMFAQASALLPDLHHCAVHTRVAQTLLAL
eukprot:CAMPEP_0174308448 /NCGR_PEP_ID=MMETSP0810-20121108/1766_1 /TAXON_ID=73025 ORGANISM="Eutreptiella gymnastica-like, Strain CCMP1594" /NCGR_SAMPLE_ID=MMETSP0810 /ASSEMBLY_ACC=CAM_ASM_000659 /LENGTH=62 /DNA_ID=CAMNT_0015415783 /DNA_START=1637 /DNA_END=1822 /DNA_ORIENTATION=+